MSIFNRRKDAETEVAGATLAAKEQVNNPYLNARRSWNGHVMGVMSSLQVWQTVGIVSLLIVMGAVGGIAHIGAQSKIIPMVFQQDASANTVSVTLLDRVPDAVLTDYQAAVTNFISNTRLVTPDVSLQRKAVLASYAYLAPQDPATMKTNEFLNGSLSGTRSNARKTKPCRLRFDLLCHKPKTPGRWIGLRQFAAVTARSKASLTTCERSSTSIKTKICQ